MCHSLVLLAQGVGSELAKNKSFLGKNLTYIYDSDSFKFSVVVIEFRRADHEWLVDAGARKVFDLVSCHDLG